MRGARTLGFGARPLLRGGLGLGLPDHTRLVGRFGPLSRGGLLRGSRSRLLLSRRLIRRPRLVGRLRPLPLSGFLRQSGLRLLMSGRLARRPRLVSRLGPLSLGGDLLHVSPGLLLRRGFSRDGRLVGRDLAAGLLLGGLRPGRLFIRTRAV